MGWVLRSQTLSFFLLLLDNCAVAAFEETPMCSVEILLCLLGAVWYKVKLTLDDMNFCECEKSREQKDGIIAAQLILLLCYEFIKFVVGFLS